MGGEHARVVQRCLSDNIPASGCQLAGSNNASITISSTVTPVTDFSYTTPVCSNAAIQSPTLVSGFTTGGTFSSTAGLSINSTTGVIDGGEHARSYNVTYNIAASGLSVGRFKQCFHYDQFNGNTGNRL